ncbi:MAG: response regulator [Anaerolineae bacterium]|nr:response regulator [Anaerolineae bacterium]
MTALAVEDAPRHILVVEDDTNTSDMLTAYFASLGYEVSHAAWGQDALSLASKILPDLIVLDIHLPDIDGYEVCMRLRSQRKTQHTPIIFLTERRERRDRLTGLELGAVDYITKPFDVQEMRYRVRNILRRTAANSLMHPITGLPMMNLITEQIVRVRTGATLSVTGVKLLGMEAFGEAYGFVTHDDILRAVGLILRNTVAEVADREPFVGQLDTYQFIMVIPESQRYLAMGRLYQRLNEAISFFYPHQDWERGQLEDGSPLPRINFHIGHLTADQIPEEPDLHVLGTALFGQQDA